MRCEPPPLELFKSTTSPRFIFLKLAASLIPSLENESIILTGDASLESSIALIRLINLI